MTLHKDLLTRGAVAVSLSGLHRCIFKFFFQSQSTRVPSSTACSSFVLRQLTMNCICWLQPEGRGQFHWYPQVDITKFHVAGFLVKYSVMHQ